MHIKKALLLLGMAIIVMACNKEVEEAVIETSFITIGSGDNMTITAYDSLTVDSEYMPKSIDLNGDLKYDFTADFTLQGSNGQGYFSRTDIQSINDNLKFAGYSFTDSVFSTFERGVTEVIPGFWNERNDYLTYTCQRLSPNSKFEKTQSSSATKWLSIGSTITNDNFIINSIGTGSQESQPASHSYDGDTIVYLHSNQYSYDCNPFPSGKDTYIAFRLKTTNDAKPKLGWIKLNISSDRIIIYESAIQN